MDNKRITILDGFRVIAIFIVLLFHFYDRFQNEKYHYDFGFTDIFAFGKLGVELFFIISGFVITLTLTNCSNFFEFIKKRLLRLIPAMLICSTFTILFFTFFDKDLLFPTSHSASNFLLSNTFVSPELFNLIFSSDLHYVDSAYWSLWVELSFYFIIAILYFFSEKNLLRNYTIVTFLSLVLFYLFTSSIGKRILMSIMSEKFYMGLRELVAIFNFLGYSIWFLLGIILFKLHSSKSKLHLIIFTSVFLVQLILMQKTIETVLFMASVYILLILFVYKPTVIAFLGNKFFSKLGLVSYSVYLIHQHIGVLIINKFSYIFGSYNWIIGVLIIPLFFLFGIFSYKYLEKPIGIILKKIMFPSREICKEVKL